MNKPPEHYNRRAFLGSLAAIGAAGLAGPARGLCQTAERRQIKLGFDNFSIRAFNWKAPQLIEYAASLKVDTLLLSNLDVFESLEADYLKKIRAQADRAAVELQVGTGSICPTSRSYNEKKWGKAEDHARLLVRTASRLGTPVARCYLGSGRDRNSEGSIHKHIDQVVKVLKAVKTEAEDAGVKIAVENHAGDMQARELVGLIEAAGKTFVGATIDPGNAAYTIEDPLVNLELLGPYVVTSGIRDTAVWETEDGAAGMWTNMGQGSVDWTAYIDRFAKLCPGVPFVLEIISYRWGNNSPYLKPEFWKRFPNARAAEFARYVALAKRGRKFELPPGRPSGATATEQSQQKFDLETSIKYSKEVLGLGAKG